MNLARDSAAAATAPADFLVCHSGRCAFALPLLHVVETMRPLPIEPLADTPPFVLGVALIRGSVTPIIDVAQLIGTAGHAAPARFVTLDIAGRQVALAVERVTGVRTLPRLLLEDPPPLLQHADAGAVAAISALDAELLIVLRSARLVPDSLWSAVDAYAGGEHATDTDVTLQ